jgi:RNA polymerase sigma-70 factor (ECF subfamily)
LSTSANPNAAAADQFVRLLTLNERRVYAYILSLVPNWTDADDILQETNVRLLNEFATKYVPGTDFGAWACTVAKFQVLTYRKKKGRERVQFTDAFLDVVADEMVKDDDSSTRHRALAGCVDEMTPLHRDMLRAYYEPGASGGAVAARFKRSIEALYKTFSRIRRALHDCVEKKLKAGAGL